MKYNVCCALRLVKHESFKNIQSVTVKVLYKSSRVLKRSFPREKNENGLDEIKFESVEVYPNIINAMVDCDREIYFR